MNQIAKYLVITGAFLLILGLIILFRDRIPLIKYLGHLPGDFRVEKESFRFYMPVTSSLLLSLLLTGIIFVTSVKFGHLPEKSSKKSPQGAEGVVDDETNSAKIKFETRSLPPTKIHLPEVEAIVDLKINQSRPVYLSRDDLLVELSLFVPSSGTLDPKDPAIQSGTMTLRDGSVFRVYLSSVDSLFLVPDEGGEEQGQLFIRSQSPPVESDELK